MEALEHLQVVHGHLRLLQMHAIATSDAPTNRFLAEFLLVLVIVSASSMIVSPLMGTDRNLGFDAQ